jgi:hypothetical protein
MVNLLGSLHEAAWQGDGPDLIFRLRVREIARTSSSVRMERWSISRDRPGRRRFLATRNLLRLRPYPTNLIYLTCISTSLLPFEPSGPRAHGPISLTDNQRVYSGIPRQIAGRKGMSTVARTGWPSISIVAALLLRLALFNGTSLPAALSRRIELSTPLTGIRYRERSVAPLRARERRISQVYKADQESLC